MTLIDWPSEEQVMDSLNAMNTGCSLCWLNWEMGLRYRKYENTRCIYEQPDIIQQRNTQDPWKPTGSQSILSFSTRRAAIPVTAAHTCGKRGFKHSLIVQAGGVAGWISNTDLVFRVAHKSGDYHSEMNAEHFLEWFEYQLCIHSHDLLDSDG